MNKALIISFLLMSSCKIISRQKYVTKCSNTFEGSYYSLLGFKGDSLMFLKSIDFWEVNLKEKCLKKIDTINKQTLDTHFPAFFWTQQKLNSWVTMYSHESNKIYLKNINPFRRGASEKYDLIIETENCSEKIKFSRSKFHSIYDVFIISNNELIVIYIDKKSYANTFSIGWFKY
jgi:hypothetical protein